jgi:hypothetical protein
MGASIGYGRTSLVVGLCVAGAGLALAVQSSFGEGVLALAIGLWITVRSSMRLARPSRHDKCDNAVELRSAGCPSQWSGLWRPLLLSPASSVRFQPFRKDIGGPSSCSFFPRPCSCMAG